MGITSCVSCRWENNGKFGIDHFSIYGGMMGFVHRHTYSYSLTIGGEAEGFKIETLLDDNGHLMPFERIWRSAVSEVRDDWNESLVIPLNDKITLNGDRDDRIRYEGEYDEHSLLQYNIQILTRGWKREGNFLFYEPDHRKGDYWRKKLLVIGKQGTSEEIAREVLLDIIEKLYDNGNADGEGYAEQLKKEFTFKLLLREGVQEADFSAEYSVKGSAENIAREWRRIRSKSRWYQ